MRGQMSFEALIAIALALSFSAVSLLGVGYAQSYGKISYSSANNAACLAISYSHELLNSCSYCTFSIVGDTRC